MQIWLVFWNFIFWLSVFSFLLNSSNFLTVLIYSELVWAILYTISVVSGSLNDEIILLSTTFFLLALAGLEFSVGFLIIILFKTFKLNLNFDENDKYKDQIFSEKVNKLYLNRYVWNFNK